MKILLLGPTGQLGTEVRKLVESRSEHNLESLDEADLDLAATESIAARLPECDFEVLVNCSADNRVDDAETDADRAFRVNAFAVREMAKCCQGRGAMLVHVSTDYVFSGMWNRPYVESDSPGPLGVYGASKLAGEGLARSNCERTLVLRTASLFGAAARKTGGNFVETMLRLGRERDSLHVVRDQIMSPTGAVDLARAMIDLLQAGVDRGTYHAVNSGQASWHEFACEILSRAGIDTPVEPIPAAEFVRPAQRPAFSVLDNSRVAGLIGPLPHWTDALDQYLRETGRLA